ncbi:MAG: arrestin family protein [Sedimenticolaceae bacterium]
MPNEVLIHLSKTDFTGGDVVEGELELKIDTAIPVRGARLLFHGYEQSYWGGGIGRIRSSGTGRIRGTHSETRDLFREELTLFGEPPLEAAALISDSFAGLFSSGHYQTLEPGGYRYPFSFTLPENLPGDYEDSASRSKIRYLLKGYLDIPLKIDIEQTLPLTIHEAYDQSAVRPVSASTEKSLFEAGTSVKISAALDKDTFLPGEHVDCRLVVENQSGKAVQAVVVNLQKTESLRARSESTTNIETVHSSRFERQVPTGESAELDLKFTLPSSLYPTIVSSELVKVEYRLVFALEIPWASGLDIPWAMDLDVELPILIREEPESPGGQ